jgi:hypothetical protein
VLTCSSTDSLRVALCERATTLLDEILDAEEFLLDPPAVIRELVSEEELRAATCELDVAWHRLQAVRPRMPVGDHRGIVP